LRRRPDRALLALVPALIAFVVFGAARVVAPVGLIGLLFDTPVQFAIVATVVAFAGTGLLFVRPVELAVGHVLVDARAPTAEETARLVPLVRRIGQRAGMTTRKLILRIEDDPRLNASAGAANLVFVTTGALRQPDGDLEALLAHELAHHRGLHPLCLALVWWLSLPGVALRAVYRLLRRLAGRLTRRAPPIAVVARIALTAWQVSVMWLYFVAELLALSAARATEYAADRTAARWGYGPALAKLLTSIGDDPSPGLVARLTATHPPVHSRIARLAGASTALPTPRAH
jgi:Zn-dependent protease with chaperone function